MRISDWSSDVCSSDLRTGPGATAHDLVGASGIDPGLAVDRRASVAVVPAVRHPLAYIAGEIVKAICIGRVRTDPRGPPGIVAVAFESVAPMSAPRPLAPPAGEGAWPGRTRSTPPREPQLGAPRHGRARARDRTRV